MDWRARPPSTGLRLPQIQDSFCNETNGEDKRLTEIEPCSEKDSEQTHQKAGDVYLMEEIVRQTALEPPPRYTTRWCGYNNADDKTEPPYHIPKKIFDTKLASNQQAIEAKRSFVR